jgi:hypothetical protein
MNKEIMCYNEKCMFWKSNHCTDKTYFIGIDKKGKCANFEPIDETPEKINQKLCKEAQTDNDLKEITQRQ